MLYDIDLADETFRAMSRDECIRATIPRKPQLVHWTIGFLPECIRATIPRKPQHPCRKVAS